MLSREIKFPFIHSLWQLAKIAKDKEFLSFEEEIKTLDAYYIECHYPPEVPTYSREECKKVLETAQKLSQFIIDKIEN